MAKYVVYQVLFGADIDGTGPERWRGMELGRFATEEEADSFMDRYHDYCEVYFEEDYE